MSFQPEQLCHTTYYGMRLLPNRGVSCIARLRRPRAESVRSDASPHTPEPPAVRKIAMTPKKSPRVLDKVARHAIRNSSGPSTPVCVANKIQVSRMACLISSSPDLSKPISKLMDYLMGNPLTCSFTQRRGEAALLCFAVRSWLGEGQDTRKPCQLVIPSPQSLVASRTRRLHGNIIAFIIYFSLFSSLGYEKSLSSGESVTTYISSLQLVQPGVQSLPLC